MKLVNKKDLTYKFGYLFDENNEVVNPSPHVVHLLNELEEEYQKAEHLNAQPDAQPMPSLDDFKFKHEDSVKYIEIVPKTPTIDRKVEESLKIMQEIDRVNVANEYNKMVDHYMDVFRFVTNGEFVTCDVNAPYRFDLKTIGNPLELDEKDIADIINYIILGEHIKEDED